MSGEFDPWASQPASDLLPDYPTTDDGHISSAPLLDDFDFDFDLGGLYDVAEILETDSGTGPPDTVPLSQPLDVEGIAHVVDLTADPSETEEDSATIAAESVAPSSPQPFLNHPTEIGGNVEVELPASTLTEPRSLFDGFEPPAPETTEANAIDTLLDVLRARDELGDDTDFLEFDLDNFCVYMDSALYPNELRPLHHLNKADRFYFDGTLCVGDTRLFVRRVPFRELPVGNYGEEFHTVGDQIWIRSKRNEAVRRELYYKLKSPSVEYARFHRPFLWIADLAKHAIDYCDYLREHKRRATIHDFGPPFAAWAVRNHGASARFRKWHAAHGSDDFRGAIVANVPYLWREAYGLDWKAAAYHRFWNEISTLDQYPPNVGFSEEPSDDEEASDAAVRRKTKKKAATVPKTTVTPYIYDLFSHMSFGKILGDVKLAAEVETCQEQVISDTELRSVTKGYVSAKRDNLKDIKRGDVISTLPDDVQRTNTAWKLEASAHHEEKHLWYGVVQKIHQRATGRRAFDVIWMYHPRDTPCAMMKYPWKKELFLSDNCTCHSNMGKVMDNDIISTHTVHWFGTPATSAEFFVRQTYVADEQRWTTLQPEQMSCESKDPDSERSGFDVADTVLVQTDPASLEQENFMIEALLDGANEKRVRLRRLLRRRLVDPTARKAPPNELVYSDRLVEIDLKAVARRCLVRVFRPDEKITTPYDRGGVGDAFFITHQEVVTQDGDSQFVPVDTDSISGLRQGFRPGRIPQSEKLQGLDLFCGAGNFGRGLEDGGAIKMCWANDIWSEAMHTYMANTKPDTCTPFLGSVDDLLRRALMGDRKTPRPGEVQFISGGSPCPGFSLLTFDKTTDKQRKNQSLVASFASYVDLYRPHYGLLENVVQMVQAQHNRHECVFSQLVSAIVGLGYQTQILFMDAWSFGASQSRSRVFLLFTALALRAPRAPAPTHSHPPGTLLRGFGLMSNGQSFGRRVQEATPFAFVNAQEATADLPDVQDAKPDYCVGFPDHRLSVGYTPPLRKQVTHIPTQPWEMNFAKAYYETGQLDEGTRWALYPASGPVRVGRTSRAWGRVSPRGVFPTITTACGVSDTYIGRINHWRQPRPLTVLEARRAQGFPDTDILLGSPYLQYKLVGNSVARPVALALGIAIREAWCGTLRDEPAVPQPWRARADDPASATSLWPSAAADPVATLAAVEILETSTRATSSEEPPLYRSLSSLSSSSLRGVLGSGSRSGFSSATAASMTPLTTPDSDSDVPARPRSGNGRLRGGRKRTATSMSMSVTATAERVDVTPKKRLRSSRSSAVGTARLSPDPLIG